jgi:NADPH:quinone reductase-like Zn-dependent oxidoreductase
VLYSDRAGDWVSTVRELTSDEGVAAVFDGVGKDTFLKGFKCLRRHRGAMIMFGEASGRSELIATRELLIRAYIHGKNPKVSKQTVSHTTAITDSNIGLEQEHPSLSM